MTTAQLSQYLETAVDLEKAVFLQARRLAQYKEEIQALDRAAPATSASSPGGSPCGPSAQTAHGASAGDFGQDPAGVPPFPRRRNRNQRPHPWPCQGWMTGAIGGVLFGLYSCHCRIFKSRPGQLLPVAHLPPFDGELPAHPSAPTACAGESPRQSWRPGKGLPLTFCAGTRAGDPGPPSGSRPWRRHSPAHPAAGRKQGRSGRPLCPRRPVPQIPDLCPGLLPCASWCSPAAAPPWKGPKVPTSSWRPSSRRGGSSLTGTKSSARGPFANPAVPPLHCPAAGPAPSL